METCEFQMGSENDKFFSALHKNTVIASNHLIMCIIITFHETYLTQANVDARGGDNEHLTNIDQAYFLTK